MIVLRPVGRGLLRKPGRKSLAAMGRPLFGVLALAAFGASAQTRSVYVTPSLSVSATATNNANLSANDKQSDLYASVTPAISIGGQSGRVKGFLNYALTASLSLNGSNNLSNSLNAQVSAEAVENWLFVDANASISQQFVDPFGTQSLNPALNNPNSTEVYSFGISPYFKGQIAGQVNYLGRAFYDTTWSGTSSASDSTSLGSLLHFDSTTRWSKLSWALDFSYREITFNPGRDTFDQLNVASLNYAINYALIVSLRGNTERSNLISLNTETTSGWGGGLRWNPSPRTSLFLEYDQRVFGSSHLYSFDYRTPRTVWAISSRQGLSTGQFNNGRGNPTSPFNLLYAQFATLEPDPVKREQLVNSFMQANGINPNAALNVGYLPTQVQLQNQNQASVAYTGLRSTTIFNVYQTQTKNLGVLSNPDNDFANGNEVSWLGFGLTWSHRLTPRSTLSLNGSQNRTTGSANGQQTTFWTAGALWTNQLAERVSTAVGAHYTVQSGSSSYTEAGMMASLTMTF